VKMSRSDFLSDSEVRNRIEFGDTGDGSAERYSWEEDVCPTEDVVERREADKTLIWSESRSVPNSDLSGAECSMTENDSFRFSRRTRTPEDHCCSFGVFVSRIFRGNESRFRVAMG